MTLQPAGHVVRTRTSPLGMQVCFALAGAKPIFDMPPFQEGRGRICCKAAVSEATAENEHVRSAEGVGRWCCGIVQVWHPQGVAEISGSVCCAYPRRVIDDGAAEGS